MINTKPLLGPCDSYQLEPFATLHLKQLERKAKEAEEE